MWEDSSRLFTASDVFALARFRLSAFSFRQEVIRLDLVSFLNTEFPRSTAARVTFWHDSGLPALRRYAACFAVRAAPAAQCPKK
jgi:hypothetical protein